MIFVTSRIIYARVNFRYVSKNVLLLRKYFVISKIRLVTSKMICVRDIRVSTLEKYFLLQGLFQSQDSLTVNSTDEYLQCSCLSVCHLVCVMCVTTISEKLCYVRYPRDIFFTFIGIHDLLENIHYLIGKIRYL